MSGAAKILLVGRGGREHAIAWALARGSSVKTIFVAPGNGGTAGVDKAENVPFTEDNLPGLVAFARDQAVTLAVVGPEAPLAAGLADAFAAAGVPCFGPSQAAARLESSKAFAKAFMGRHGIPTARFAAFAQFGAALAYLGEQQHPVVVKASGLAAGKGVVLPESRQEAEAVLKAMLLERTFGAAGAEVLIEERLEGPEASVLAFCDGTRIAVMPVAQDHKRAFDGDMGPNTGGMGAYAPAGVVTPRLLETIKATILEPAVRGMAGEGTPFVGVLYAGLMLTTAGPKVIEFNCRLGDPETQAILPLLDSDLAEIFAACAAGRLDPATIRWRMGSAVAVVAASDGYPGPYARGKPIHGLSRAGAMPDTMVFHAGTKLAPDGRLLTDGGRVVCVSGLGRDFAEARARAYAGIGAVAFEGMHYRRDIGAKAS